MAKTHFSFDDLSRIPEGGVPCPPAAALVALASGRGTAVPLAALPRHLLGCARCTNRWDVLQRDEHIDLADLKAIDLFEPEAFLQLRAKDHVRRCQGCARRQQVARTLVRADGSSVRWSNLGVLLRQLVPVPVLRGSDERTVSAVVMDADGRPVARGDQLERVDIAVVEAELSEGGRISVDLAVPGASLDVTLAVATPTSGVAFAPARPASGRVRFEAETRVPGQRSRVESASLAIWIRR